jgi:hypothetical protein
MLFVEVFIGCSKEKLTSTLFNIFSCDTFFSCFCAYQKSIKIKKKNEQLKIQKVLYVPVFFFEPSINTPTYNILGQPSVGKVKDQFNNMLRAELANLSVSCSA